MSAFESCTFISFQYSVSLAEGIIFLVNIDAIRFFGKSKNSRSDPIWSNDVIHNLSLIQRIRSDQKFYNFPRYNVSFQSCSFLSQIALQFVWHVSFTCWSSLVLIRNDSLQVSLNLFFFYFLSFIHSFINSSTSNHIVSRLQLVCLFVLFCQYFSMAWYVHLFLDATFVSQFPILSALVGLSDCSMCSGNYNHAVQYFSL